jgi:hypothetical protein
LPSSLGSWATHCIIDSSYNVEEEISCLYQTSISLKSNSHPYQQEALLAQEVRQVQNGDRGAVAPVLEVATVVSGQMKMGMMRMRASLGGSVWMMMIWMKGLMRLWVRIGMLGVTSPGEMVGLALKGTQVGKARVKLVCIKVLDLYS